ncbi:SIS domain-containing protein, partial [Bacillus inaquosorum]|nr:SIS domain-containing protein [Bacillus inaquosorum]
WIHSHAIHAGEYFHGPFEIIDESVPFIILLGLDETRPLEERALTF